MMRMHAVAAALTAILLALSTGAEAQQWRVIEAEDRPMTVTASGVVAPADGLLFGPPPSQTWRIAITKLAREGTRVAEGDLLAEFDGSASDDRIKEKQAQLNTRSSELASLLERQAREIEEDKVRLADARSEADKAARKAAVDPSVYAGLEYRKLVEERLIAEDTYAREQRRAVLVAQGARSGTRGTGSRCAAPRKRTARCRGGARVFLAARAPRGARDRRHRQRGPEARRQ